KIAVRRKFVNLACFVNLARLGPARRRRDIVPTDQLLSPSETEAAQSGAMVLIDDDLEQHRFDGFLDIDPRDHPS
ncbi:MAG: hypothetical protein ACC726_14630, partial [Chloroflexota bacterium]